MRLPTLRDLMTQRERARAQMAPFKPKGYCPIHGRVNMVKVAKRTPLNRVHIRWECEECVTSLHSYRAFRTG